jgi:secondary thiamine-phosphate synthase enzyme
MHKIKVSTSERNELIDITDKVQQAVNDLGFVKGVITVFTPHTTAAITINENADPDVTRDIIYGLNKIVPSSGYYHSEGNSDSHIKSSMIGASEQIIVESGQLKLGTWQGIYFCEFDGPRLREVWVQSN